MCKLHESEWARWFNGWIHTCAVYSLCISYVPSRKELLGNDALSIKWQVVILISLSCSFQVCTEKFLLKMKFDLSEVGTWAQLLLTLFWHLHVPIASFARSPLVMPSNETCLRFVVMFLKNPFLKALFENHICSTDSWVWCGISVIDTIWLCVDYLKLHS